MLQGKKHITWITVFMLLVCGGWFINSSMANNERTYYKIDKGLFYLKEVFETVSRNYVDELDPENLSKSAIDGMLKEFDPYTVFFEDPGSQQMRMITRGKYGGVGMEISVQDDRITVIAPMEGTPAKRAGIIAGDVITRIDGLSTKQMSLEDASQSLRGKIGTQVSLEIERPGVDLPLRFELNREEIVLKDVTFAEFLESGTAYIRLSAFSDKAAAEFREVLRELDAEGPIERVILDLRGNPGGLLTSAVEVANFFLQPGELVVYTRGSHENENKFFTKDKAILPDQPLVVLVDQASASASEIVAGAIQDTDRGVIVGTETFGKGLVQKVYPIDKVSQAYLKITTAKYYIPSGRSIQKDDYKKNTEVFVDLSDSVEYDSKINYYTQNGRVVHGGGGIRPDVPVAADQADRYIQNLSSRGYFFRFVVDYLSRNPLLKSVADVNVDDQMLQEFNIYLENDQFLFSLEGESQLKEFLKVAEKNKYSADVRDLVEVALQRLDTEKSDKFNTNKKRLTQLLEAEFADVLEGATARIRSSLRFDAQLKKATEVLHNIGQYQDILASGK